MNFIHRTSFLKLHSSFSEQMGRNQITCASDRQQLHQSKAKIKGRHTNIRGERQSIGFAKHRQKRELNAPGPVGIVNIDQEFVHVQT